MIITKLQVAPVELDVSSHTSSESSCAVRLARHSQNAWAQHVERVASSRVEPSGIWPYTSPRSFSFLSLQIYSLAHSLQVVGYFMSIYIPFLIMSFVIAKLTFKVQSSSSVMLVFDGHM